MSLFDAFTDRDQCLVGNPHANVVTPAVDMPPRGLSTAQKYREKMAAGWDADLTRAADADPEQRRPGESDRDFFHRRNAARARAKRDVATATAVKQQLAPAVVQKIYVDGRIIPAHEIQVGDEITTLDPSGAPYEGGTVEEIEICNASHAGDSSSCRWVHFPDGTGEHLEVDEEVRLDRRTIAEANSVSLTFLENDKFGVLASDAEKLKHLTVLDLAPNRVDSGRTMGSIGSDDVLVLFDRDNQAVMKLGAVSGERSMRSMGKDGTMTWTAQFSGPMCKYAACAVRAAVYSADGRSIILRATIGDLFADGRTELQLWRGEQVNIIITLYYDMSGDHGWILPSGGSLGRNTPAQPALGIPPVQAPVMSLQVGDRIVVDNGVATVVSIQSKDTGPGAQYQLGLNTNDFIYYTTRNGGQLVELA